MNVDRHIPIPVDRPYPFAVPVYQHIKVPVPVKHPVKNYLHGLHTIKEYLTAPDPPANIDPWQNSDTKW